MEGQGNRIIQEAKLQRSLRQQPTAAEQRLWQFLRGRQIEGFKFRRQHPFLDYVLDFVCLDARLVIEVDGGQHTGSEGDRVRDQRLQAAGFRVLRFWNNQALGETEVVLEVVLEVIRAALLATLPPLQGEGRGGDGVARCVQPHPPSTSPLEGGRAEHLSLELVTPEGRSC